MKEKCESFIVPYHIVRVHGIRKNAGDIIMKIRIKVSIIAIASGIDGCWSCFNHDYFLDFSAGFSLHCKVKDVIIFRSILGTDCN